MMNRIAASLSPEGQKRAEFASAWNSLSPRVRDTFEDTLLDIAARRIEDKRNTGVNRELILKYIQGCLLTACTNGEVTRLPNSTKEIPSIIQNGENLLGDIKAEGARFLQSLGEFSQALGNIGEPSILGPSPIILARNDLSEYSTEFMNYNRLRRYVDITKRFMKEVTIASIKNLGSLIPPETSKKLSSNFNLSSIWFRGMCLSFIGKEFGIDVNPLVITDDNLIEISKRFTLTDQVKLADTLIDQDAFLEKVSSDMLEVFAPHLGTDEKEYIYELLWRYSRDIVGILKKAGPFLEQERGNFSLREYKLRRESILRGLSVSLPILHKEIIIDSTVGIENLETAPYNIWVGGIYLDGVGTLPNEAAINLCIALIESSGQDENGTIQRLSTLRNLTRRIRETEVKKLELEKIEDIEREEQAFTLDKLPQKEIQILLSDLVKQRDILVAQRAMFGYLGGGSDGNRSMSQYLLLEKLNLQEGTVLTAESYLKLNNIQKQIVWERLLKEINFPFMPSNFSFSTGNKVHGFLYLPELGIKDMFVSRDSILNRQREIRDLYLKVKEAIKLVSQKDFIDLAEKSPAAKKEYKSVKIRFKKLQGETKELENNIKSKQETLAKRKQSLQGFNIENTPSGRLLEELERQIVNISQAKRFKEIALGQLRIDASSTLSSFIENRSKSLLEELKYQRVVLEELIIQIEKPSIITTNKRAETKDINVSDLERVLGMPTTFKLEEFFGSYPYYKRANFFRHLVELKRLILGLKIKRGYKGIYTAWDDLDKESVKILETLINSPLLKHRKLNINNPSPIAIITGSLFVIPIFRDLRQNAIDSINNRLADMVKEQEALRNVSKGYNTFQRRKELVVKSERTRLSLIDEIKAANGVLVGPKID